MSQSSLHSPSLILPKELLVIVQARLNSSRLPCKILLPFRDMTILSFILSRLKEFSLEFVLATTDTEYDDLVCRLFDSTNISRGEENNLYARYLLALSENPSKYFVRLTADNPLSLIELIPYCLSVCKKSQLNFLQIIGLPIGTCFEVYNTSSFIESSNAFNTSYAQEHINDPYLSGKIIRSAFLRYKPECTGSLTIDTVDDYIKVSNQSISSDSLADIYAKIGVDIHKIIEKPNLFSIEPIDTI